MQGHFYSTLYSNLYFWATWNGNTRGEEVIYKTNLDIQGIIL
jgi:hypothetical protein